MGSSRTIITLPEDDRRWLLNYSRSQGISMAEAVRHGIRSLKTSERQNVYESLLKRTRGLWRKGEGLQYQREVRSEWDEQ